MVYIIYPKYCEFLYYINRYYTYLFANKLYILNSVSNVYIFFYWKNKCNLLIFRINYLTPPLKTHVSMMNSVNEVTYTVTVINDTGYEGRY